MNIEKKLSNNAVKSWIFSRTIFLLIIILIYILIRFITPNLSIPWVSNFVSNHIKAINIISFIIIGLTVIEAYIEPFFEYKQWSYKINENEVYFKEGIFFTRSVTIPIVRIQNIKLNEGPINRMYNLASVKIGTAGGDFEIPNLDRQEVDKIVEFLRKKINENIKEELLS